ncbi:MAG: hypothetical protein IKQ17_00225 [Kiritimatiellae bacterium]|nr:hypothetical protein [Kiritimatiellia bacterium]
MNLLKLITRNGRRDIARGLLKEYVTPANAVKCGVRGVNALLGRINDKEKLGAVALNLEQGANLVADISAAIKDGEVTAEEAGVITEKTTALLGVAITQERVDALVERIVEMVK